MSIKKIGAAFLATIFVFSLPFTASAAEDLSYKGKQSFAVEGNEFQTSGDLKICTEDAATFILHTSNDNQVGSKKELGGKSNGKKNPKCGTFTNLKKGKYHLLKEMKGSPAIDIQKATVKFYD